MKVFWTNSAVKKFKKFDKNTKYLIDKKIKFWFSQQNPLKFAIQMAGIKPVIFRFRINNIRIIGKLIENNFIIFNIGKRSEIYK